MIKCHHYKTEQVQSLPPETRHGSRDVFSSAKITTNVWCDHDSSPKIRDENGKLVCDGDKDKCPIT